ncbi:MAG: hypothetical protein GY923_15290 [Aestuariibacter sp.]|nr:hypothetical protein [Aestuariibacter sp.]
MEKTQINLQVLTKIKAEWKAAASERGIGLTELIKRSVEYYLSRKKRKQPGD